MAIRIPNIILLDYIIKGVEIINADYLIKHNGVKQVETSTITGTITTAGNILVTVSSSLFSNVVLTVAVALNDNNTQISTKIRAALNGNSTITNNFTVSGTNNYIILTTKVANSDDDVLNISVINDTSVGLINTITSVTTVRGQSLGLDSESWLYRVFGGIESGDWDFYTSAIEVLVNRNINSPKKLDIRIGFPNQKPSNPTIAIISPSEQYGDLNTIGLNHHSESYFTNSDGTYSEIYARNKMGIYEVMVISPNEFEAELLYRFLDSLLISMYNTLNDEFDGTFKFSGKETISEQETIPFMYIKSLLVSLQYNQEVPILPTIKTEYLDNAVFNINNIII
jgi:hypothetical protein